MLALDMGRVSPDTAPPPPPPPTSGPASPQQPVLSPPPTTPAQPPSPLPSSVADAPAGAPAALPPPLLQWARAPPPEDATAGGGDGGFGGGSDERQRLLYDSYKWKCDGMQALLFDSDAEAAAATRQINGGGCVIVHRYPLELRLEVRTRRAPRDAAPTSPQRDGDALSAIRTGTGARVDVGLPRTAPARRTRCAYASPPRS